MNRPRHRRTLASLTLGASSFALLVGLAHACSAMPVDTADGAGTAMSRGPDGDEDSSGNCREFCSVDTPLLSKLQLVREQPAGRPLLAAGVGLLLSPAPASAVPVTHPAPPPPDVPLLLRTLRLAL